jgi:hypothetical protein
MGLLSSMLLYLSKFFKLEAFPGSSYLPQFSIKTGGLDNIHIGTNIKDKKHTGSNIANKPNNGSCG